MVDCRSWRPFFSSLSNALSKVEIRLLEPRCYTACHGAEGSRTSKRLPKARCSAYLPSSSNRKCTRKIVWSFLVRQILDTGAVIDCLSLCWVRVSVFFSADCSQRSESASSLLTKSSACGASQTLRPEISGRCSKAFIISALERQRRRSWMDWSERAPPSRAAKRGRPSGSGNAGVIF